MQSALRETGWNKLLVISPSGRLAGWISGNRGFQSARSEMAKREVNERWQREMAGFFVEPAGLLPDRALEPLEEVFHL